MSASAAERASARARAGAAGLVQRAHAGCCARCRARCRAASRRRQRRCAGRSSACASAHMKRKDVIENARRKLNSLGTRSPISIVGRGRAQNLLRYQYFPQNQSLNAMSKHPNPSGLPVQNSVDAFPRSRMENRVPSAFYLSLISLLLVSDPTVSKTLSESNPQWPDRHTPRHLSSSWKKTPRPLVRPWLRR